MILHKLKGILSVFTICAVFTSAAVYLEYRSRSIDASADSIRYILDAGHGDPDGGTVGIDGATTESQLNLAITQKISNELHKKNVSHQLTRTDENSIYTEGETIHAKKVSDVRNRISIAQKAPAIPLISIHMNSYPDRSVYGIQVFYGNGEKAQTLANELQATLNNAFQPNHTKVAKEVSKNIYLFSHIDNPVILIECGFLSNNNELEKLKTEEYQLQLASAIAEVLSAHS